MLTKERTRRPVPPGGACRVPAASSQVCFVFDVVVDECNISNKRKVEHEEEEQEEGQQALLVKKKKKLASNILVDSSDDDDDEDDDGDGDESVSVKAQGGSSSNSQQQLHLQNTESVTHIDLPPESANAVEASPTPSPSMLGIPAVSSCESVNSGSLLIPLDSIVELSDDASGSVLPLSAVPCPPSSSSTAPQPVSPARAAPEAVATSTAPAVIYVSSPNPQEPIVIDANPVSYSILVSSPSAPAEPYDVDIIPTAGSTSNTSAAAAATATTVVEDRKNTTSNLDAKKLQFQGAQQFSAKLLDQLTCSICFECMVAPHVLGGCNHAYCGICIDDWLKTGKKTCPQCRAAIVVSAATGSTVAPNPLIANIIETMIPYFSAEDLAARKTREAEWEVRKAEKEAEEARKKVGGGGGGGGRRGYGPMDRFVHRTPPVRAQAQPVYVDEDEDEDDEDEDEEDEDLNDDEDDDGFRISYSLERARSGRSTCRTCHRLISNGAIRFCVEEEHNEYHHPTTYYHHLACFAPRLPGRYRDNVRNVPGYQLLNSADLAHFRRHA
ncbi:hypothetical protein BDR26DRAFT_858867 [Obelidium mucronatum]|nr:hypothetical protein BDR26DRAFT_858867 [Obelidium mucronatum]